MNPSFWQIVNIVVGGVILAALLALAKHVNGKADKTTVQEVKKLAEGKADQAEVDEKFKEMRADNKSQADESSRQYRELLLSTEGVKKEIAALDKHSLTVADLADIKADIKELVRRQQEALKLIDNMPDRVTSLEATRNKQSER